MTVLLRERGVEALVLDIEGTTTPVAFVYEVLFPYARARLREYLRTHLQTGGIDEPIRRLRDEWAADVDRGEAPPAWADAATHNLDAIAGYLEWLMDRDRKSPALKWLQGAIWESGYRGGVLRGQVFEDVRPAFERWARAGIEMAIYSSGSELAQRRLFETTPVGDLTSFISRFFDTTIGPKTSPDSYRRIARSLSRQIEHMLFVSDAVGELDAARAAGCRVALCVRPDDSRTPGARGDVPIVQGFDEILV